MNNKIMEGIKNNYWLWVIGLVLILLLLVVQYAYKTDLQKIDVYYQEEMERCNCVCPEAINGISSEPDFDFNMNDGGNNYESTD